MESSAYYSIGRVVDTLKDEFPDISISKLRYLESKGLITPERSSSGYRKYRDNDVNQIRRVLKMQREQFLQ